MYLQLQRFIRSGAFNTFIMIMIGVNALVVGLETVERLKLDHGPVFEILDFFFLSIYSIEFVLKICAEKSDYWKSGYNIFDATILGISLVQVILDQLNLGDNVLKVLRLLRAARTLRAISFIEGLQVLVTALVNTIRKSVLNVLILLVLLMLFFGVVGYYIFGYEETGDKECWGDLSSAMLTLFTFVTADGWTEIQKRLDSKFSYSQWFTIVFIFLGHFIFSNLFIGIIIMNIHEATDKFLQAQKKEKEALLKKKKEYLYKRQHDDVRQMLEKQKASKYANFQEMTKSFFETLRHDDYVIMTDVSTNLTWLETYLGSLDHLDTYTYRVQQSHRNLASILAEIADRCYKRQYGISLNEEEGLDSKGFFAIDSHPSYSQSPASDSLSSHAHLNSRPVSIFQEAVERAVLKRMDSRRKSESRTHSVRFSDGKCLGRASLDLASNLPPVLVESADEDELNAKADQSFST